MTRSSSSEKFSFSAAAVRVCPEANVLATFADTKDGTPAINPTASAAAANHF
jgi:hypothetical protein